MKKIFITAVFISLLLPEVVFGGQFELPRFMNFHAEITDGGGNLLPDGTSWFTFRIVDDRGSVLFQERQELDVVGGRVSAMIGNGIGEGGLISGGVIIDAFLPDGPKYLEVIPDDAPALEKMELVTVPYSIYAQTAIGVVSQGVTSDMIAKGAITKDHLSEELFAAVFPGGVPKEMLPSDTLFEDDIINFKNSVQSSAGAATVGVDARFVYSGSATVQGVLSDLDMAIKKRQEEVVVARNDLSSSIAVERSERAGADSTNAKAISDHSGGIYAHGSNGAIIGKTTLDNTISPINSSITSINSSVASLNNSVKAINNDLATKVSASGGAIAGDLSVNILTANKVITTGMPMIYAWATIGRKNPQSAEFCNVAAGSGISYVECSSDGQTSELFKIYFDKNALPQPLVPPYMVQVTPICFDGSNCKATSGVEPTYQFNQELHTDDYFSVWITGQGYRTFNVVVIK